MRPGRTGRASNPSLHTAKSSRVATGYNNNNAAVIISCTACPHPFQKPDRPTSEPEVKDEEPSWPFQFHFLQPAEASLCDLGALPPDLGPLLSIRRARKDGGVNVNLGDSASAWNYVM